MCFKWELLSLSLARLLREITKDNTFCFILYDYLVLFLNVRV